MAKVQLDSNGPKCPRCGGRNIGRRSVLSWGTAKMECRGCGKALHPAGRIAAAKAKRSS